MGHHGYPEIPQTKENFDRLKELFEKSKQDFPELHERIGATGEFPDGQLNEQDKGGIEFGVMVQDGRIIMHFGEKPITWIGFSKQEAIAFRDYLNTRINQLT